MTPDELRRMDNNECIIFEKGLKPIRAKKFWYYKTNMIKDFQAFQINHNDYDCGERGNWRKFNPYDPYSGSKNEEQSKESVSIGSLDDLFEDTDDDIQITDSNKADSLNVNNQNANNTNEIDNILPGFNNEEAKRMQDTSDDEIDIEKELEAKFDELFGPINNNNND